MVKMKFLLFYIICLIIFACQTNNVNVSSVSPIIQNTDSVNLAVKDTTPVPQTAVIPIIGHSKQISVRSIFPISKLGVFLKKQLKSDIRIQNPQSIAIQLTPVFDKQALDTSYIKSFFLTFSNKEQYNIIFESNYLTQYVLSGKNAIDTLWQGNTLPDLMWNTAEACIVHTSAQSYLVIMGTLFNATGLGIDDTQCFFWDLKTGQYYEKNSFLGIPECFNDFDQNGTLNFLSLNMLDSNEINGKIYYSTKMYELKDSTLVVVNSPFDQLFLSKTESSYNFSFVKKIPEAIKK